jgi:hypothetical protein
MTDIESTSDSLHANVYRKRKRISKLDKLYYSVANHLLDNARAKKAGVKKLSLEGICKELDRKHGVKVNKSTLSRFIGRHNTLKLL